MLSVRVWASAGAASPRAAATALPGSSDGRFGGNADFSADAGLGIRLGPLGAYWTVPLSGHGHGFNLFVRVAPRI
jgi:hypothetical protein